MKNKYVLTGEEYTQLEKDALDLLIDYGFIDFPIDVFKLAKVAFDVEFIKYSSLKREVLNKIKSYDSTKDGFTIFHHYSDKTIRYSIYYEDSVNVYRQRYTIGHEIKHILYTEEEPTEKEEIAAEYFSKVLIAPKCKIIKKGYKRVETIVEKFGLSYEASTNHLKGINNRRNSYGNSLFDFELDYFKRVKEIKKKNKFKKIDY